MKNIISCPRMLFDDGEIQSKQYTIMILIKAAFCGFLLGWVVLGSLQ